MFELFLFVVAVTWLAEFQAGRSLEGGGACSLKWCGETPRGGRGAAEWSTFGNPKTLRSRFFFLIDIFVGARGLVMMLIPLVCLMAVASASDPTCKTGIEHDTTICCAKSCGRCGGTGCESLPGGPDSCCAGQIKKNGKSCATSDPPCNTVPSVQYALVLDAAPPASKQLFHNHSWPSWGGTIVRGTANDSHPYHLFAASFANGCGLYGWIRNGIVIHATASTPAGPYTFHDVALPVFQHNPHAVKHPDGTYLLFGIGQANNASWECPCHDGRPIMPDGKPATDADAAPIDHAQLHISRSPYGPWENVMGPNGRDYLFEPTTPTRLPGYSTTAA